MNSSLFFYNPVQMIFGKNSRVFLNNEIKNSKCLIVSSKRGRKKFSEDQILQKFLGENEIYWIDEVNSNPDIREIQKTINLLKGQSFNSIIAFGGGSVMDTSKAIALSLKEELKNISLNEMIANPKIHQNIKPIPLFAIPTTAGTGGEVTPFATIWDHSKLKKFSLSGSSVFPAKAIVDPYLTEGLPKIHTLYTGLDAINQAMESIWNKNATNLSINLATQSLKLGLESLPFLMSEKESTSNRVNMAQCSLLAGLAISQTRTALCHSISYPLTAHFNVPHGLACAFTMPIILKYSMEIDDGRLLELAKNLISNSAEKSDLLKIFEKIHADNDISEKVKKKVKDLDKLLELIPEMITTGRAENSLFEPDLKTIEKFVIKSWNFKPEL